MFLFSTVSKLNEKREFIVGNGNMVHAEVKLSALKVSRRKPDDTDRHTPKTCHQLISILCLATQKYVNPEIRYVADSNRHQLETESKKRDEYFWSRVQRLIG